jgi:aldose 1-epimerase
MLAVMKHSMLAIGSRLIIGLMAFSCGFCFAAVPTVEKADFGKTSDGTAVELYTLKNSKGMTAKIMTYGAILVELHVPDRQGNSKDVVLGFDSLDPYLKGHPLFGAVVGRYANRIAKAQFTIGGKTYQLAKNTGKNHIHGGPKGFDKVIWKAGPFQNAVTKVAGVKLIYNSPDGENGFPGNLRVVITYTLSEDNELRIDYEATTDQDTPINLTNHSYFNLAGADSGDVLGHELQLMADNYTPADDELIPTGEIAPVKGTPLDFTRPTPIGARIKDLPKTSGYDHNFVINGGGQALAPVAKVHEPKSGRVMEVLTTEPGVQLYTANHMRNLAGKGGAVYGKHQGFCLETQHYPDAVNKPQFPSPILKAGATFKSATVFKFSAK